MTRDPSVSNMILSQLGGNRFSTMVGMKYATYSSRTLSFQIGSNPKNISGVHIELEDDDTYTMTFFRIKRLRVEEVAKIPNVYAEQLREVFTRYTGLETSL
jgi:hypothetical protein